MRIEDLLKENLVSIISELYNAVVDPSTITIQKTNKEFVGDYTLVVFPFTKISRKSPDITAVEIGEKLKSKVLEIDSYEVIKGFLNLSISANYFLSFFSKVMHDRFYGYAKEKNDKTVMVEFSSPNTNKPLHLGHIRNILLGWSVSEILKAAGNHVIKANLVNDRGVHICKTMYAWSKWGNGETPEQVDMKGDHFVGNFYVLFEKNLKLELEELKNKGLTEDEAKKQSTLLTHIQELLRSWEDRDMDTINLWKKMNSWVYKGFEETYEKLEVSFDCTYHESETYLLGKAIAKEGVEKGRFIKKEDESVWVDLVPDGMDEKLLLRADGTSVYMTQDMGTAVERFNKFNLSKAIYIVGNEQDYHFKVLKLVLKKMDYEWADKIHHLSYGMVELPSGKMKSREGTVVDADDLIEGMIEMAHQRTKDLGKTNFTNKAEQQELYSILGLGALKYFILKVDPVKNMLFNPDESIEMEGNTGPFIQYTFARIQSVLRRADEINIIPVLADNIDLQIKEKELLLILHDYPKVIEEAAVALSPAIIANYVYELAKGFNQFYHDMPILNADNETTVHFRLLLAQFAGETIKSAMKLLGIEVPFRM